MTKIHSIIFVLASIVAGCSTVKKSVYAGMGAGAALGASGSALVASDDRGRTALVGGLSSALLGGIAGYFFHHGLKKRDERVRKKVLFNLEQHGTSVPLEGKGGFPGRGWSRDREVFIITDDPKLLRRLR